MDATPNLSYEVKIHSFLPNLQLGVSQLKSQGSMAKAKMLRDRFSIELGPQHDMQRHMWDRIHTPKWG